MNLFEEFQQIVHLIEERKIQYALVGAVAMAFYAEPRFTQDIDLLRDPQDISHIKAILEDNGYVEAAPWTFKSTPLTLRRFFKALGSDQMIMDILVAGAPRHLEIIRNALPAKGKGGVARVASKSDLVWLKQQRNSLQDQADIERLRDEGR